MLADSAYGGGQSRKTSTTPATPQVIKPIPIHPAVPGGFERDDFVVDHDARTVTCPEGETVAITAKGTATFGSVAGPARCGTGAPPAGRDAN